MGEPDLEVNVASASSSPAAYAILPACSGSLRPASSWAVANERDEIGPDLVPITAGRRLALPLRPAPRSPHAATARSDGLSNFPDYAELTSHH